MAKIQVIHIRPIGNGRLKIALFVFRIPIGMLRNQHIVGGGMVGHPINDDVHPQVVGFAHHAFEIVHRAVIGIKSAVVLHGIMATQRTFSIDFPNGVNGHEPNNFDTHIVQPLQLSFDSLKVTGGRKLSDVHFVNSGVGRPSIGLNGFFIHRLLRARRTARGK